MSREITTAAKVITVGYDLETIDFQDDAIGNLINVAYEQARQVTTMLLRSYGRIAATDCDEFSTKVHR